MSHVGIAVCPGCGARYGAQAQLVGQTIACPACGTPFVVQPSAASRPQYDPPGAPPTPVTTRVLGPAIAPKRRLLPEDMPWGLFAAGAGLCAIVAAVVIGGWYAASAVGEWATDLQPAQADGPAGPAPAPPAISGIQAATGAAASLVEGVAGKLPTGAFGDTHASCMDERDKLKEELRRVGKLLEQGDKSPATVQQAVDVILRLRDLAIRWHALTPMTEADRQALRARHSDVIADLEAGRKPNVPEPIKIDFFDPVGAGLMMDVMPLQYRLGDIQNFAYEPVEPANPFEESYDAVCDSCGQTCRHVYAVKAAADCDRIQAAVDEQVAAVKAAENKLRETTGLSPAAMKASRDKYFLRLAHEQGMLELTVKHAIERAVLRVAKTPEEAANVAPEVKAQMKQLAERLKEFQKRHESAVAAFQAAATELDMRAVASRGREAESSPSSRIKAVAPAGAAPLTDAEREAVDKAVGQLQRPGSRSVLLLVRGGSPAQRASEERHLTSHAQFGRWIAIDTAEGMVLVLDAPQGVNFITSSAVLAKVIMIDEQLQAADLAINSPFSAGRPGQRLGHGLANDVSPAAQPDPSRRRTFKEAVQERIEKFEQEEGADKTVVVTAAGGTAAKRKALEAELVRLTNPRRRSASEGMDLTIFIFRYEGDVAALAQQIRTGKAEVPDAGKRAILVKIE